MAQMIKYKALKRGYDGNRVIEPGEEFEFSGVPGAWMEPLESVKPKIEAVKLEPKVKAEGEDQAPKIKNHPKSEK